MCFGVHTLLHGGINPTLQACGHAQYNPMQPGSTLVSQPRSSFTMHGCPAADKMPIAHGSSPVPLWLEVSIGCRWKPARLT